MPEATNLAWEDTPFGGARRPFAERTSLLVAVAVPGGELALPTAAAAVYLRLPRGQLFRSQPLAVTDTTVRFGFHAVAADDPADVPAVVSMVDRLLVQARRRAVILAGHGFADELARLTAAAGGRPTPGITAVAARWQHNQPEPGTARFLDTAPGPHPPPALLSAVCAEHRLVGLPPDSPPLPQKGQAGHRTASELMRRAVVRALAIALITAQDTGYYWWDAELDLGDMVEAEAWDQLPAAAAAAEAEP
ncbi:MAG: hypothetical protein IRZ05_14820 [Micromonosporaceae bacterium]|nr:hypothetical protein [Micromonosporaceae bacterium]